MRRQFSLLWQGVCRRRAQKPYGTAAFLITLLVLQVLLVMRLPNDWQLDASAGTPPSPAFMRLASLGEEGLAAYATALYLQAFDAQAGTQLPLRLADFRTIRAWLELAFALNPKSGYPLMLAAFEYVEAASLQDEMLHPAMPEASAILDFVERGFRADPAAHWRWLVHACWIARYRLHDDQHAAVEAQLLRNAPAAAGIPQWARELDLFLVPPKDAISAQLGLPTRSDSRPQGAGSGHLQPVGADVRSVFQTYATSRNAIEALLSTSSALSEVQTLR